jgi:uncharacterized protein (TIGR02246 family)
MNRQEPTRDRGRDEAEIRAIETSYDNSWSRADMAGLLSVLEPDVVIVDPLGGTSVGVPAARRLLQDFLSGPGFASTHASRPKRVSFVSCDVALFDGEATIEGPNLREPLVHGFTDVLVRREGRWRIAHTRAYVFMDADAF